MHLRNFDEIKPFIYGVICLTLEDFHVTMRELHPNGVRMYTHQTFYFDDRNHYYRISNEDHVRGRRFDGYFTTYLGCQHKNYSQIVNCLKPSLNYRKKNKWDYMWNLNKWKYNGV